MSNAKIWISNDESVWKKSTDQGGRKKNDVEILTPEGEIVKLSMVPKCYRSLFELVSNALDRPLHGDRTKKIYGKLSKDGVFTLFNDNSSMPIKKIDDNRYPQKFQGMWTPQFMLTEFNSGTNHGEDVRSIQAGINGRGAKGARALSDFMEITTCDGKKKYHQTFKNKFINFGTNNFKIETNISDPGEPEPTKEHYFEVKCKLKWEYLEGFDYDVYCKWFRSIFQMITNYLSVYCSGIDIQFNGEKFKPNLSGFRKFSITTEDPEYNPKINYKSGKEYKFLYRMEIFVRISKKKISKACINGLNTKELSMFKWIYEDIAKAISNDEARVTHTNVKNNIDLYIIGQVVNAEFSGQGKTNITMSKNNLWWNNKTGEFDKLVKFVKDEIGAGLLGDKIKDQDSKSKKNNHLLNPSKSDIGLNITKRTTKTKYLIVCEGDSAMRILTYGNNVKGISDFINSYFCTKTSCGGVPANVIDKVRSYIMSDGSNYRKFTDKIAGKNAKQVADAIKHNAKNSDGGKINITGPNKFIHDLCLLMKLDLNLSYETKAQRDCLVYDKIVCFTDQDLDGMQINGLLLAFFSLWPALFKHGYIWRFQTPVIKVKSGSNTINFDTMYEFEEYSKDHPKAKGDFYKGLGSHSKESAKKILSEYKTRLIKFVWDDNAQTNMEKYYHSSKSNERKLEYKTPARRFTDDELDRLNNKQEIDVSTFLEVYVKEYQLDNMERKIPNLLDYFTQAGRKLMSHSLDNEVKNVLTATYGAKTAANYGYHHGSSNLDKQINSMTHNFSGAGTFPLLITHSSSGTYLQGGKDAAAARYTHVSRDRNLLKSIFVDDDKKIIPKIIIEGESCERRNLLPVIPLPLYFDAKGVTSGYNFEIHARDSESIRKYIYAWIDGQKLPKLTRSKKYDKSRYFKVYMSQNEETGEYSKSINKTEFSVGVAKQTNDNRVIITVFPKNVFPDLYRKKILEMTIDSNGNKIRKKKGVINCISSGTDDRIEYTVYMEPGYEKYLPEGRGKISGLERHLDLAQQIYHRLNYYYEGKVYTFDSYEDYLNKWLELRKEFYHKRIEYKIEFLRAENIRDKNIVKYNQNRQKFGLDKNMTEEELCKILEKNKFLKINNDYIINHKPEYIGKLLTLIEKDGDFEYILDRKIKSTGIIPTKKLLDKIKLREDLIEEYSSEGYWKNLWKNDINAAYKEISRY